jgi:hypothetical protein
MNRETSPAGAAQVFNEKTYAAITGLIRTHAIPGACAPGFDVLRFQR